MYAPAIKSSFSTPKSAISVSAIICPSSTVWSSDKTTYKNKIILYVFILLGRNTESLGDLCAKFQDNVVVSRCQAPITLSCGTKS